MPLPLKEYDWKRINGLVTQMCWELIGYNGHAVLDNGKVHVIVECASEDPCDIQQLEELAKQARLNVAGMEGGPFRVTPITGDHTKRVFTVEMAQGPDPACLPTIEA
jgi:hypothetical protein